MSIFKQLFNKNNKPEPKSIKEESSTLDKEVKEMLESSSTKEEFFNKFSNFSKKNYSYLKLNDDVYAFMIESDTELSAFTVRLTDSKVSWYKMETWDLKGNKVTNRDSENFRNHVFIPMVNQF